MTHRRATTLVLVLLGVLLYAKTLHYGQFLFDGHLYLKENPLIRDLKYFLEWFDPFDFAQLDEELGLSQDVTTNFMLRPVSYLTFAINYKLGGYNPAGFRAVNIVIHILNTLLVYGILERIVLCSPKAAQLDRLSARFIPTATALVFLLHPMQTESVTYITQRFTSMAACFYLSTIWLYLRSVTATSPRMRLVLRVAAIAVLFLGMLVKESVFTAPFMILLLELIVMGSTIRQALKRLWPLLCLVPLVPILVVITSAAQSASSASLRDALQIVNYERYSIYHYAITELYIVLVYLRLYLLPYGQNVDPDYPLFRSFLEPKPFFSAVVIVAMIAATVLWYLRNRNDIRAALILFGTLWYFLAISVTSSFIPLPDLMAEHRPYLAAIGFLFVVITAVDFGRSSKTVIRPVIAGLVVWCLVLGLLTNARNDIWQSKYTLWSDAVLKSPRKDRPWYNLGLALNEEGRYLEALRHFYQALQLNPRWSKCYEGLSVAYLNLKDYPMAVESCRKGIELDPKNPVNFNNLGIAYAETGALEPARQAFKAALALRPGYQTAYYNLEKAEYALAESRKQR